MYTFTSISSKKEISNSDEQFERKLVVDTTPSDEPQAFTVYVKDAADWEEIHNYIINENEIDGIPNRRVECINEMQFSEKRSVYNMSDEEASVLRSHPKVDMVVKSSMHNPIVLEQRKLDEEFDRHIFSNRFKSDVTNRRTSGNPGTTLNFTQWGLLRHSSPTNNFVGVGTTTTSSDIQYSLTGKNVDVVIMDTGVRYDHPEFLLPGYNSVPVGVATETVSRVRDILIHGQDEYGINWSSQGLTAPGSGTLANYTKANVLKSASFNGSWHGSHVAGIAAGNQFGAAFEANIWSIACVGREDVGFADPSDGFDYIRVWHKNKPINPLTGRRNPTIVNGSWGLRQFVYRADTSTYPYTVDWRGTSYNGSYVEALYTNLPAVYYIDPNGGYYEFTSKHAASQASCDELFDDPLCRDVIAVFAAGNAGNPSGKQDVPGGIDYDNQFTSGYFYYGSGESGYGEVDEYFNRSGTPAITHQGQPDAPIIVGSLDSTVVTSGITSERKSNFSNTGPAIDVWAAGSTVLSPFSYYNSSVGYGFADPRNSSFYNQYISGTSMAAPNVTGVLATYLQSNPSATRIDVRDWLYRHGSVVVENGPGNPILNTYKNVNPIGAGTSVNYWSDAFGLKDATARVLYNPFANNTLPSISGVNISGISFTQS